MVRFQPIGGTWCTIRQGRSCTKPGASSPGGAPEPSVCTSSLAAADFRGLLRREGDFGQLLPALSHSEPLLTHSADPFRGVWGRRGRRGGRAAPGAVYDQPPNIDGEVHVGVDEVARGMAVLCPAMLPACEDNNNINPHRSTWAGFYEARGGCLFGGGFKCTFTANSNSKPGLFLCTSQFSLKCTLFPHMYHFL